MLVRIRERNWSIQLIFAVLVSAAIANRASGQGLIVRERIGARPLVAWGAFSYYPSMSPYARPAHGPSIYRGYGPSRLEGRLLFLPTGVPAPASPAGVERFTVARTGQPAARGSVIIPSRPSYYPRKSYIRPNPRRSYRGGGYR